jgi:hypothetical protein
MKQFIMFLIVVSGVVCNCKLLTLKYQSHSMSGFGILKHIQFSSFNKIINGQ